METTLQKNCRLCIKINTAKLEKLYKNERKEKQGKKRRIMKKCMDAFYKKYPRWFFNYHNYHFFMS